MENGDLRLIPPAADTKAAERARAAVFDGSPPQLTEDLLAAVLENCEDAIIGIDLQGRVFLWNQGACRMFGYEARECVGRSIVFISPPERRYEVFETLCGIAAGEGLRRRETVRMRKNGERFPVAITHSPIFDAQGRLLGISGAMRDISGEKAAEQALLLTHERLLESQRLGGVGAWEWDLRAQSVWWSDESYRIFGLSPHAFLPTPEGVLSRVVPDDRPALKHALSRSFSGDAPFEEEYRIWRDDGSIRHVRSLARLDKDAHGAPLRLIGHIQDVTERKRSERTLRRSEERLEESQKIAHVGAWEWDLRENRIWWSKELYRLFEQDPDAYTPTYPGLLDRIHPGDRNRVRKAFEEVFLFKRPCDIEARIVLPSGSERTVRALSKVEVDRSGALTRFIGTAQDITESRKLSDALEELNEQLEQRVAQQTAALRQANDELQRALDELRDEERLRETFISALTHDLRTPLIGQQRALEFLQNAPGDALASSDEISRLITSMQMSNRDLLAMVNRLLEAYQFEAGVVELSLAPTSLPLLIQQCFDELFSMASAKSIRLSHALPADGFEISGDWALLKRVCVNLLGNALRHTPQGGHILVRGEQTPESVRLYFCDDGPGVAEQARTQLFEKFFTRQQAHKKIGSGLGLYICKMIVSLHGGEIALNEKAACGAEFVVTLPRNGPTQGGNRP
ncbi:MAG: PAS domain-containing protein [Vampirovibrionales bacterium]|nr:PAS domain-containing protein [Vampirovibrionales bacterium]